MPRYETAVEAPCKSLRYFAKNSLLPQAPHTPMLGKSSARKFLERRHTFASFNHNLNREERSPFVANPHCAAAFV
ncbi:MAG TPA: hypothetical protein VFC39_02955 [Acidobacteriaceae bacterium]|nr:hypothetical protein [Acidobacteriaceae bacterium]